MKSPFSAWFLLYAMAGVCVVFFVHEAFFRDKVIFTMKAHAIRTTGTVRSLDKSADGDAWKTLAVVLLADGNVVTARVVPACPVGVGDRVAVDMIQPFPLAPKTYLVTGAMP